VSQLAGRAAPDPALAVGDRTARTRPGGIAMSAVIIPGPRRLPHTFPLCIHCLVNPAGFWVSRKNTSVVRRPWCLSCCNDLDRERCDMIPFGR